MLKPDLIKIMAAKTGLPKKETSAIIELVLSGMSAAISTSGKILISGFGTFYVSRRSIRRGINPRTGQEIQIGECLIPRFKPARKLIMKLNAK